MVTLEEIVAFGASETERRGGPRADPRANLEYVDRSACIMHPLWSRESDCGQACCMH